MVVRERRSEPMVGGKDISDGATEEDTWEC